MGHKQIATTCVAALAVLFGSQDASAQLLRASSTIAAPASAAATRRAALAAAAEDSDGAENATCSCTAQCTMTGDPHLVSFYGISQSLTPSDGQILVYAQDGFEVSASTFGSQYVGSVTFGDDPAVTNDDCDASGQLLGPYSHVFADGDSLALTVECVMPSNTGKHGDQYHLNLYLNKTDVGADGDFASMESSAQASGACTKGEDSAGSGQGYCSCQAACVAKGDPHLTSFYGSQELLSDDQDVLYAEGDDSFSLLITMYSDVNYIGRVDYDGKTYVTDQCDASGEVLAMETLTVPTGSIFVKVWCQFPSKGGPAHLNVRVQKTNEDTAGASFQATENAAGASGKCLDQTSR